MINLLTGEFILKFMPNGGRAVLYRSAFVTAYLYLLAIGLKSYTGEHTIFKFSLEQFVAEVHRTIPWGGAIFGAVYAALYARFSSQWAYIADLYNQQLAAAATTSEDDFNNENYEIWQAAFIEDAVCMHLATKRGFSGAIYTMLQDPSIRVILEEDAQLGKSGVLDLEKKLNSVLNKSP